MTEDEDAEETETWRLTAADGDRRTYTHEADGRRTDVTVRRRPFDGPAVDVAGPHDPAPLFEEMGVDPEETTVRRWDRVEAGRGTWLASCDGDRKRFRHVDDAGTPTVGVAALDDDDVDELTVTGPNLRPVLDAFDETRADRWHVTGVENPGERVVATAGRAARAEWSTDRPGVDAAATFDADGRVEKLMFDGPDPATIDPEAARRASVGPIVHDGPVEAGLAERLEPASAKFEFTNDPDVVARSKAYLRMGRRGEADLLRSVDDARALLDEEQADGAPALAAVVEELREDNVESLAGSRRFREAMSEEARERADRVVTTDVLAAGPNLDGVLDGVAPNRAGAYLAWHAGDDPTERAELVTGAAADVVAWPEDVAAERTVRTDDGERRRVTRCATGDDAQSYVAHVDGFGRETHGYLDHETDRATVSGPNEGAVTEALGTEPSGVIKGEIAGPLLDMVESPPEKSLVESLDDLADEECDASDERSERTAE